MIRAHQYSCQCQLCQIVEERRARCDKEDRIEALNETR